MTSSYQQNEDLPLTMENEVKVEAKKYSWYIVAVTSVIAVMVLFAYTSNKSYLNMRAKVSSFRTTQLGSFNNPREGEYISVIGFVVLSVWHILWPFCSSIVSLSQCDMNLYLIYSW